ncbi:MAG: hypothetical protein M3Y06_11125 [Actinomycetota bacterium]|nr:hypothetical protein [Actinomycetota bacterium]
MTDAEDPDWYLDNVLIHASPGDYAARISVGPAALWQAWWRSQIPGATVLGADRQGFVCTVAQATAAGFGRSEVRRARRRRERSSPARSVLASVCIDGADYASERRRHALAASGAALLHPGQTVSGRSAAILHGLPTLAVPSVPEMTQSGATLGRRAGAQVRGATISDLDRTDWFGAPVTTIPRTLVDLARHSRRDALMAADAALREAVTDRTAIEAALASATGWPGIKQARAVLALANPLSESPLESITRLALHDDGFPPPQLQVEIVDPTRRSPWRVDLLWPDARLILECDGQGKYTAAEARRERRREARLRALGYRIERLLWTEIVHSWPETSGRLRQALAAR